jgi:hypothetical protein
LDPERIAAAAKRYDQTDLVHGSLVPDLVRDVVQGLTNGGIRCELPVRTVINAKTSPSAAIAPSAGMVPNASSSPPPRHLPPLLVFLVVYIGESMPLTRSLADNLRLQLDQAVVVEQLGLSVPPNCQHRMVSKPFPLHLLQTLLDERNV